MSPLLEPALCQELLAVALANGGDYADIFVEKSQSNGVLVEEERVKSTSVSSTWGVGIRVSIGEATGFAVCEDPDPVALRSAASRAAHIAAGGGGTAPTLTRLTTMTGQPNRHPVNEAQASLAERVAVAQMAADRAARGQGVSFVQAQVNDRTDQVTIATSDGVFVNDLRPYASVRVRVTGEHNGRRESTNAAQAGRRSLTWLQGELPQYVAATAVERLRTRLDTRPAPAGTMAVILAPGVGGVMLHEAVGHGLEADFDRKGTSAYARQVGAMVAAPEVTVIDVANVPGDAGCLNVDDEGVIAQDTPLIVNGRLVGYMQDRLCARLAGRQPTGNGRRQSYHYLPQPRMRITTLAGGPHVPAEILASVKNGLYVTWIGGGSVDISKGDFNFNVEEAWLIENGRLTRPVSGACLIGNGPQVMRSITMLGNDPTLDCTAGMCGKSGQSVPVGFGCPTTLIPAMVVGGRS